MKQLLAMTVPRSDEGRNEDAWAFNGTARRAAVADGVSNDSYMSADIAQAMADAWVRPDDAQVRGFSHYLRQGLSPQESFAAWLKPVAEQWSSRAEGLAGDQFQRDSWARGGAVSRTTFIGVETRPRTTKAGQVEVVIVGIGDSAAVVAEPGAPARVITQAKQADDPATHAIAFTRHGPRALPPLLFENLSVAHGTKIWLMTDALYAWYRSQPGINVALLIEQLEKLQAVSEFTGWVRDQRRLGTLPVDDTTCLILRCEQSADLVPNVKPSNGDSLQGKPILVPVETPASTHLSRQDELRELLAVAMSVMPGTAVQSIRFDDKSVELQFYRPTSATPLPPPIAKPSEPASPRPKWGLLFRSVDGPT